MEKVAIRAWNRWNGAAIDDLYDSLTDGLAQLSEEELGDSGRRVRDVHPREWMFEFGMLQVMRPPDTREDPKH